MTAGVCQLKRQATNTPRYPVYAAAVEYVFARPCHLLVRPTHALSSRCGCIPSVCRGGAASTGVSPHCEATHCLTPPPIHPLPTCSLCLSQTGATCLRLRRRSSSLHFWLCQRSAPRRQQQQAAPCGPRVRCRAGVAADGAAAGTPAAPVPASSDTATAGAARQPGAAGSGC
jgi:hypothetical protein